MTHRSNAIRRLVSRLDSEGIGPSNIARVCNAVVGACQEQTIIASQCGEIVRGERRNNVGRDCMGIIKYFKQREKDDDSFFFFMDVGDDGTLHSVFWTDGQARTAFHQFNDVLVFDMTYKTNKFRMSFAPFINVKQHIQSILFGGALSEDETTFS